MADNKFKFGELLSNIEKTKRELPTVLAVKTQNYFVKSFSDGGWEGKTWKPPQRNIQGTKEYKYSKWRGKPTLVNTSRLRGAVNSSIRTANWQLIRMVVDLPYARRHNEGLDGMPRRTYMADSSGLREMQQKTIDKYFGKLWRV